MQSDKNNHRLKRSCLTIPIWLEGENLRVGFDCARGATRGGQRLQLTVNVQFRGWGLK